MSICMALFSMGFGLLKRFFTEWNCRGYTFLPLPLLHAFVSSADNELLAPSSISAMSCCLAVCRNQ